MNRGISPPIDKREEEKDGMSSIHHLSIIYPYSFYHIPLILSYTSHLSFFHKFFSNESSRKLKTKQNLRVSERLSTRNQKLKTIGVILHHNHPTDPPTHPRSTHIYSAPLRDADDGSFGVLNAGDRRDLHRRRDLSIEIAAATSSTFFEVP